MSADLLKRALPLLLDRGHADTELALKRVDDRAEARAARAVPYTPADPADWASPPPTTVGEALDRLASANPGA